MQSQQKNYDFKDYTCEMYSAFSPVGVGIASAIIPGLGQRILHEKHRADVITRVQDLNMGILFYGFAAGYNGGSDFLL